MPIDNAQHRANPWGRMYLYPHIRVSDVSDGRMRLSKKRCMALSAALLENKRVSRETRICGLSPRLTPDLLFGPTG